MISRTPRRVRADPPKWPKWAFWGVHPDPPGGPRNHVIALIHSRKNQYKLQTFSSTLHCWKWLYHKTAANPAYFLPWAGGKTFVALSQCFFTIKLQFFFMNFIRWHLNYLFLVLSLDDVQNFGISLTLKYIIVYIAGQKISKSPGKKLVK